MRNVAMVKIIKYLSKINRLHQIDWIRPETPVRDSVGAYLPDSQKVRSGSGVSGNRGAKS